MLPSTIWAPSASRSALSTARTVARVPTGMKHGVVTVPRAVVMVVARAGPLVVSTSTVSVTSEIPAPAPAEEHGVTERQEPVAVTQRVGVQVPPVRPGEGLDQDEQARPWQVEVGHEDVDDGEVGAGREEQPGSSRQLARPGCRLESPDRRGADRDDPVGVQTRLPGLVRHGVALLVHDVVVDVTGGDRPEGAQSDDEIDVHEGGAGSRDLAEDAWREVQAGGRRGHGTRPGGVHRLVALGIVEGLVHVRRQRDLPVAVEGGEQVVGSHLDEPASVVQTLPDHDREVGTGDEARPRVDLPAGTDEGLPASEIGPFLQQQHLDGAAGRLRQPDPGRQDPGVVDHHDVAGTDEGRQIGDGGVVRRRLAAAIDQQPGPVAGLDGVLGDGGVRQLVVEVGGLHRDSEVTDGPGREPMERCRSRWGSGDGDTFSWVGKTWHYEQTMWISVATVTSCRASRTVTPRRSTTSTGATSTGSTASACATHAIHTRPRRSRRRRSSRR